MVVPGGNKADLQDAIDDLYTTVRGEWTTSLIAQTHTKAILVWIPALLALYAATILIIGRIRPPRLRTSGSADWGVEKTAIFAGACIVLGAYIAERYVSYSRMNNLYESIPPAIEDFVHLSPPSVLASLPTDPCQGRVKANDLLTSMCGQKWVPNTALAAVLQRRTVRAATLHQQLIETGAVCRSVGYVPGWWTRPESADPEKLVKMGCTVVSAGQAVVQHAHFQSLGGLVQWLGAQPSDRTATLRLEDIFNVRAFDADPVYAGKVQDLLGPSFYNGFRHQYWQTTGYGGLVLAILVLIICMSSLIGRTLELKGSVLWFRVRRTVVIGSLVVFTAIAAFVSFQISFT
jgi:hypothetical protein